MSTATVPSAGPSPESLLARYRATGDPQAIGALFDATAPTLFRIGLSLLPDAAAAEDAVQETFLAALEHLERYDAARPVMPWLVGILQMMAKRSRREGARRPDPVRLVAARAPAGDGADVEEGPDLEEDSRRLREAIDALEEPYRSAALLRWRYGLTPAEIADVRSEHPGTTRSILSRGLARMREALKGAPAAFLLPTGGRGLDAVKRVVLERASGTAVAASVAAGAGAGLWTNSLAAWGLAAAGVLVVAGGAWWGLHGSGSAGSGPSGPSAPVVGAATPGPRSEPPRPGAPAPVVEPEVGTPPPEDTAATSPSPTTSPPTAPPTLPSTPDGADGPDQRPTGEPEAPIPPPFVPAPPTLGVDPAPSQPGAPAAPALPDDELEIPKALDVRIGEAVERGVRWLKGTQLPDGSWGVVVGNAAYDKGQDAGKAYTHPAGPTALALYALLKCGVELEDPVVKKGFAYLRTRQRIPQGAYELSMCLLAVTATADPYKATKDSLDAGDKVRFPSGEWREWAQKLHDALLAKRAQAKTMGLRYFVDAGVPLGGNEDLSSTQLAALALLVAERCGIKTDSKVWNELLTYAMRQQEATGPEHPRAVAVAGKDGAAAKPGAPTTGTGPGPAPTVVPTDHARGFAYILSDALDPDEGRATGGMTACGLATVQIARNVLLERRDRTYLDRDRAAIQRSIWDGLAWLDLHWSPFENPQKKEINRYHVYYLYCVERACDLLGNVRLGKHFWYREMAGQLVGRQSPKGFWDSATTHKPTAVLDTSFALLFLRRATKDPTHDASVTEAEPAAGVDGRGR